MKHFLKTIELATKREMEFLDITDKVQSALAESSVRNGFLTIFTHHTTTSILINEKEDGLQKDMAIFLSRLAPAAQDYYHDQHPQDGRLNTHSHLQSLMLPTSQLVLAADGKLKLGPWQSIFFVELDGPRPSRQITVQVIGE